MIHYITPGSSDLNYGKQINEHIKHLPIDDWVVLRDIDTMPAYHEKFFWLCEQYAQTDYGLIGCMTNRLGLKHHLHNEVKSEVTDWKYHREIGKQRFEYYKDKIEECQFEVNNMADTIGGVFMMFPVKTWKFVMGFPEGGISINGYFIDYLFSKKVLVSGLKIGLALGLYMIHMYRPDARDTRTYTQHLR